MAHTYRSLQQWNQWLERNNLAKVLLEHEHAALLDMLSKHFGKHAMLIGAPNQVNLLNASRIPCHSIVSPIICRETQSQYIEAEFQDLPVLTGSVDLVMLPHTLEFLDNPRKLLSEACRIVKPEGLIVICGFNPFSLWGARRLFSKQKETPWSENFIQPSLVKRWLKLLKFELEKQSTILFRPPVSSQATYQKLNFLESLGKYLLPKMGGVYILVARAKVIPLTPIRMKWKQQINNIRISTSISGHIARHDEAK